MMAVTALYHFKRPSFPLKREETFSDTEKYGPYTGKNKCQYKPPLREPKHWTYWTKTFNELFQIRSENVLKPQEHM